jgi:hypothetical protein
LYPKANSHLLGIAFKPFPINGKFFKNKTTKTLTMSKSQPQKEWLALLQKHMATISLPDLLAEQFHISLSAAYRRINGETPLTFDELSWLLATYPMSLESTLRPNTIRYTVPALHAQPQSPGAYLDLIEKDLTVLAAEPTCLIQYMANEIPFFYYLLLPEMAYFKLYMWSFTVWQIEGAATQPFDIEAFRKDVNLNNQIKKLIVLYSSVASEEIWNINMLDTTLNQIQYCQDTNRFNDPADALFLVEKLKELTEKLKGIVAASKKLHDHSTNKPIAFNHIWYNEIFHNNMFIIANLPQAHILYSAFDVPNFIKSIEPAMTHYGTEFFNRTKNLSAQLDSPTNSRQATKFFTRLKQRINQFDLKIEVA